MDMDPFLPLSSNVDILTVTLRSLHFKALRGTVIVMGKHVA